jgi:hypothetical protein
MKFSGKTFNVKSMDWAEIKAKEICLPVAKQTDYPGLLFR